MNKIFDYTYKNENNPNNENCKSDINNSKILDKIKLLLSVRNKIIDKRRIDDLITLYNESKENEQYELLLEIIYYIWEINDEKIYMKTKTIINDGLFGHITMNRSVDLSNCKNITYFKISKFIKNIKYISNIRELNLLSILLI